MQRSTIQPQHQIFILIAQFWLSGMWILSLIFTVQDSSKMENINLFMFITLGVGSLVGGYVSDIFDRTLIFKIGSLIWVIGSAIALSSISAGYIISAGCIGLLNNLTFVMIMEKFPIKKDLYTIYVLIGWAASEITLGIIFYIVENTEVIFMMLFVLTLGYAVAALLFLERDNDIRVEVNQSLIQNNQEVIQEPRNEGLKLQFSKMIPHSLKSLVGGCILMFVMQMFYYRTQFTLDRFGVSLQLNTIVVGLTQLVANVVFIRFINRFPRKMYLRIFLIILAFLFIVLIFVSNKMVQTLVEGVMRLFDTCIMIILGVYLPELFDIDERGKGTNYVMSFGVLGSALNSVILNRFQFWQLILFLVAGFAATFLFKESFPKGPDFPQIEEKKQLDTS